MWRTALTSFISAVLGGLLVLSMIGAVIPPDYRKDSTKAVDRSADNSKPRQGLPAGEIYKRFGPGVVHIRSTFTETVTDFFGFPMYRGTQEVDGSGFIIDKSGLIVTNAHVVQGSNINATTVKVFLDDKTGVEARLLGTDINTDLALLRIDPGKRKLTVLELGDSSKLNVGDTVYTIGSPFGLDGTMTQGIVSALNRTIYSPNRVFKIRNVIQTDAAVNLGNSGGPLISSSGKVIGVNSAIASTPGSVDFAGIAFAIPSNTVKDIVSQIRGRGKASHPWIGIAGRGISEGLASLIKLPISKGVIIERVSPGSPAEEAGLKGGNQSLINNDTGERLIIGGDIIARIGDVNVASMNDIQEFIDKHRVGDRVELEIYRGDQKKVVTLKLAERPEELQNPPIPKVPKVPQSP
ncbi:MAG: trypsin-like peptidase domain-containing protein [Actinobacteria bacterium]|nr:trypsin-like peptidase domain-containing protein [Actinomycetota bacterium]